MTDAEIDALSGRDLDRAVGEQVFGKQPPYQFDLNQYLPFASDIRAAWKVVEELDRRGFLVTIKNYPGQRDGKPYYEVEVMKPGFLDEIWSGDSNPATAVCRAALQAVAGE